MPTIQDGRDAIEQGNPQQARLIFEAILQETPRSADAWLGLAEVLTDSADKQICYENVLKIDKTNRAAKEGLRNLEPQANPLIAALQEKAAVRTEEDYDEDDDSAASSKDTMVSSRENVFVGADTDSAGSGGGPPTFALVAIGLVLSVVMFAIGGGLIFFVLTALTSG